MHLQWTSARENEEKGWKSFHYIRSKGRDSHPPRGSSSPIPHPTNNLFKILHCQKKRNANFYISRMGRRSLANWVEIIAVQKNSIIKHCVLPTSNLWKNCPGNGNYRKNTTNVCLQLQKLVSNTRRQPCAGTKQKKKTLSHYHFRSSSAPLHVYRHDAGCTMRMDV